MSAGPPPPEGEIAPSNESRRPSAEAATFAVHRLGPRVTFELLGELDRHHGLGEDLDRRLERYAALDPVILRAVGGDHFPPRPLRGVPR